MAGPGTRCYIAPADRLGALQGGAMSETTTAEIKVASLHYAGDDTFVGLSPSGHALVTGFRHDAPNAPTPMELILLALGGCTGADVISILQKKRQQVTDYRIEVRAE